METSRSAYNTPDRHLKLHVSNIQLLASIDSALALVTLIFNCRQVITSITGALSDSSSEIPRESDASRNSISPSPTLENSEEGQISHSHLIAASVSSLCLTLTQLLLACLVMVYLSYINEDHDHVHNHRDVIPRKARVISGIWVVWSGLLCIVLIIYVLSIKRFEDFSDKFYMFMLVSEIVLRLAIVTYTTVFFCCGCRFKCCC